MKNRMLLGTAGVVGGVIVLGQMVNAFAGTGARFAAPDHAAPAAGDPLPEGSNPDVIVGAIPSTVTWASNSTETAYSIATTSCNIGTSNLDWYAQPDDRHPVIGQNLFRLSADGLRFEQIGQSWLKHAFCALQLDLAGCGSCPNASGCLQHLEPGCSDPYNASRNGSQNGLGPKWQANANTGVFPVPWDQGDGTGGSYLRRLRAKNSELSAASNPATKFFVEAQYVTQDDAGAGNQDNNASYRRVTIVPGSYQMNVFGPTQMMQPGIQAWADNADGVTLVDVHVPGEGYFIVGYKVVETAPGTWAYEYAVYNMNSDRSGRSFDVPVPAGVAVSAIDFHDVDYHSGEPWEGTDWSGVRGTSDVTWTTESYASNPNANALRWGTLYNFRFVANAPPVAGTAALGLFKPGTPTEMLVPIVVPDVPPPPACAQDIDGSGAVDFPDLLAVLTAWGACGGCPEDLDDDGAVGFGDLLMLLASWGACP